MLIPVINEQILHSINITLESAPVEFFMLPMPFVQRCKFHMQIQVLFQTVLEGNKEACLIIWTSASFYKGQLMDIFRS